jgi:hypothetical protein
VTASEASGLVSGNGLFNDVVSIGSCEASNDEFISE